MRYIFDIPSDIPEGSKLTTFKGDFFIDKAGGVDQQQARVTWDVIYGQQQLCTVTVDWNEVGHCSTEQDVNISKGNVLEITEHILAKNPDEALFAVVLHPAIDLQKPC